MRARLKVNMLVIWESPDEAYLRNPKEILKNKLKHLNYFFTNFKIKNGL